MIIGIGGVGNAGKSTLAKKIKKLYPENKVRILCQDDYVKPNYELPLIHQHIDYEIPDSIDFQFYRQRIVTASNSAEMILAEGLFAFYDASTVQIYDREIFLHIREKTFFQRKNNDLRWGKEPAWYIRHIWQSYLTYGAIESGRKDVLYLSGEKETPVEKILDYIQNGSVDY